MPGEENESPQTDLKVPEAVTAGVVGVILNLAVWFGWHVVVPSGTWAGVDWFAIATGAAAFVALHRFKVNLIMVIAASGAAGLAWRLVL